MLEQLRPAGIITTPTGRTSVDVGQNITGRVRLRVHGESGRTIQLRHAEVLEAKCSVCLEGRHLCLNGCVSIERACHVIPPRKFLSGLQKATC